MSKSANPGELKTAVVIESYTEENRTENGYLQGIWKNVFGKNYIVKVKWINAHGKEVFEALSMGLNEPVTITMRYSPLITSKCRLILLSDTIKESKDELYYEIISIDDVENKHKWLEVKAQRKVAAM